MRFQTRLLLVFSLLIVLLVGVLGVGFYRYSTKQLEQEALVGQEVAAAQMLHQLDNLVRPMDFISTYFLSIEDILTSLRVLSEVDRNNPDNALYVMDARQSIKSALLSYSFDRNFHRVNILTRQDFLTSNFVSPSVPDARVAERLAAIPWYGAAEAAKGRVVLIPPFRDPWGPEPGDGPEVFALVRAVQGGGMGNGYVEIQRPKAELTSVFTVAEPESVRILARTREGALLYAAGYASKELMEQDLATISHGPRPAAMVVNSLTDERELISITDSTYSGVTIFMARNRNALLQPIVLAGRFTVVIGLATLLLSLAYIAVFTNRLTKPIRELKQRMEQTELGNLPEQNTPLGSNNEIESLNQSFGQLRARLNEAVKREIQAHALQMQAHFDSLQAQVNPHFLFNTLNVLSHRGLMSGDEEVCEICDSIAAMLRYSTETGTRHATVAEEVAHVGNYLLLMKKRLEHKLVYHIEVDPRIRRERLPRIVLQQIAENAVVHGMNKAGGVLRLEIIGTSLADGWQILIRDNGGGFAPETLSTLKAKMTDIRRQMDGPGVSAGMGFGGMGIVNTCARLHAFFQGDELFRIGNAAAGAEVVVGACVRCGQGSAPDEPSSGKKAPAGCPGGEGT